MQTADSVGPRCDKDRTLMTKVRVRFPETAFEGPAFQCIEPGCTRYFMDGRGYFDSIVGSVLAEKFQQRCPKCNGSMYLREAEQEVEIWRCPLPQCGHEQRMVA